MPRRKRYLAFLLLAAGSVNGLAIGVVWTIGPPMPRTAPAADQLVIASGRPATPIAVPDDVPVLQPVMAPLNPVLVAAEETCGLIQQTACSTDAPKPHEDPVVVRAAEVERPPAVAAPTPSLSIEVRGPTQVERGETLSYEIVATNSGPMLLAGVRVEEQLPIGAKLRNADPMPDKQGNRLVWNLGILNGHEQRHLRIEILPDAASELILTATAMFTPALGLRTKIVQPPFAVTQTIPTVLLRGATAVIQVQLANRELTPLTHVVLHDRLPPGLVHPRGRDIEMAVGTLAAGETKTLRFEVVAEQTGQFVNEVSAVAEGGRQVHSSTAVQVADAALAVNLEAPEKLDADQDTEIRVEAFNPGPADAVNVRLTQQVPDGFDLLAIGAGGIFDRPTHSVTWSFDTLPPGERQVVSLSVRPKRTGNVNWEAVLAADRMAEARVRHTMDVTGTAILSLKLATRAAVVAVGEETILEVRALNQGSAATSMVRLSVQTGEGLLLTHTEGPTTSQQGEQSAVFHPMPILKAHSSAVYQLSLRGLRPGDWRLVAEIMDENSTQPVRQEFVIRVQ